MCQLLSRHWKVKQFVRPACRVCDVTGDDVLSVLITLLSQLSSQDIARKLMQRTVQTVSNVSNSVTNCLSITSSVAMRFTIQMTAFTFG